MQQARQPLDPVRVQEALEAVQINHTRLASFLDYFGLEISKQTPTGDFILKPSGLKPDDFAQYWLDEGFIHGDKQPSAHISRRDRYKRYQLMDANSTEAALTLDTYADEAGFSGTDDTLPIVINIGHEGAQAKVLDILDRNHIIGDRTGPVVLRSHLRELAKYGELFFSFYSDSNNNITIVKEHGDQFIVNIDEATRKVLGYSTVDGRTGYHPWDMAHFAIHDSEFYPYGRSILEPMRAAFQQLLINEALLALSRASRVERLVIKVPVPGGNAAAAFSNLTAVRQQYKNVIFGGELSAKSGSRVPALSSILWLPAGEDYGIDRLSSTVDVAKIEDVQYFRDKFLMGSRLPKSYLLADSAYRLTGGVLQAQDVKFARALLLLQYAFSEGLTLLICQILILLGYDITQIPVSVKFRRPQALNEDVLARARESLVLVDNLRASYSTCTGNEVKIAPDDWATLTANITGLPLSVLKLFESSKPSVPLRQQPSGTIIPFKPSRPSYESTTVEITKDRVMSRWAIDFTGEGES